MFLSVTEGQSAMSNILLLTSSLFGEKSQSRAVAAELLQELRRAQPRARLVTRDLNALPHLSGDVLQALGTSPDARSAEQHRALALADELIEELEAANVVVIAAPMYNFTVSSPLKAWIDHVARAGRTFRYTADGPIGLLKGKEVFVASATGGVYSGGSPARAMDFQEPTSGRSSVSWA
jgi:FMN-dependent NADH-azoreductase